MPEINLDLLKNKKKFSNKYRPYDLPTPKKRDKSIAGIKEDPDETKEPVANNGMDEQHSSSTTELNRISAINDSNEVVTVSVPANEINSDHVNDGEVAASDVFENTDHTESTPVKGAPLTGTVLSRNFLQESYYKWLIKASLTSKEVDLLEYIREITNNGQNIKVHSSRQKTQRETKIKNSHFGAVEKKLIDRGYISVFFEEIKERLGKTGGKKGKVYTFNWNNIEQEISK